MRLSLTCEHGTRTVELDEGREGLGNVHPIGGKESFAQSFVNEVMPRCPFCLSEWQVQNSPRIIPQERAS